jgi:hypothetical protein
MENYFTLQYLREVKKKMKEENGKKEQGSSSKVRVKLFY